MRLISFEAQGNRSFGILRDDAVIDARKHLSPAARSLRDFLGTQDLGSLATLQDADPDYRLEDIRYRPVVDDAAAKILCVGVNYMPHIREMGREKPAYPVIFVRFMDSLVGHGEPLVRPRASEQFDFEGELAVVIGKRARHVARADALGYVAGYSCFNDGSVRDYQRHGPQWTPGKNFHHSGSFGPWLVTRDELPDPGTIQLTTRLNGDVVQSESVAELCFGIPELLEYITTWVELEPGDVIATGTPGGVGAGRNPPLWMRPGDRIEVELSGVGRLRNPVVAED